MPALNLLARRDCAAILLASVIASLSVASAALLVFADDSRSEWLAASPDLALGAGRCDTAFGSTQRHTCLREAAEAQRAINAGPMQVAQH